MYCFTENGLQLALWVVAGVGYAIGYWICKQMMKEEYEDKERDAKIATLEKELRVVRRR